MFRHGSSIEQPAQESPTIYRGELSTSRIRHYLLEWKDNNLEEFCDKYGEQKLRDFSKEQVHDLFSYATTKDSAKLSKN